MAEYSNNLEQTVNANQPVVFTDTPVPCERGFVRHREGTGNFLLSGYVPNQSGCACRRAKSANYLVDFGANIAIPTGGTVGPISLAIAIDGSPILASTMTVTPSAVEQYFNVSRALNVDVWRGCCETLSIVNVGNEPILVQNSNLIVTRPDLYITR